MADAAGGAGAQATPAPPRGDLPSLLVLGMVLGIGIGPAVAAGAAVGGALPPVLAALLMTGLTATGLAGLVISAIRWRAGARCDHLPDADHPAARFATLGQRASFGLAAAELLVLAVASPVAWALHLTGPQEGPGKDVGAVLVAALALVAVSALVVPTIAAQVAWTWRGSAPAVEAAVLARAVPGRRRLILVARTVAVVAWVLAIVGGAVTATLLVGEAAQRLRAVASAYSPVDAADAVRGELLDRYVVGDIRCPGSLPAPGWERTFTCRVSSLDRSADVAVRWFPSGFGTGGFNVVDPDRADLVRVADLPGPVPTAVAIEQDVPAAVVVDSVRTQLLAEGWSRSSRAVRDLRCPSVGRGPDPGFVRCTIGQDPRTQRYVDVYPVSQERFAARAAEIADLPR